MQTTAHPAVHPDEVLRNLRRIDGVIPMYVDGKWRLAVEGGTRQLFNPSNGQPIALVAEATEADAHAAIAAARRAFDDGPWRSVSAA
ncbi:MAG: aldehyde dehydrogenase family protein, partial [Candidatus Cybelea sp.]